MTLAPNFLPVGSVVEKNTHNGWKPTTIDSYDIVKQQLNGDTFNEDYRPIPLTPEILTEWCNMKLERKQLSLNIGGELFEYAIDSKNFCIYYSKLKGWTLDSRVTKDTVFIKYLHQLQHLYSALTQTVLPITIK